MTLVKIVVAACFYLHCFAVFIVNVAVGSCKTKENAGRSLLVVNFMTLCDHFANNEAAYERA